jgi:hypothetical protein
VRTSGARIVHALQLTALLLGTSAFACSPHPTRGTAPSLAPGDIGFLTNDAVYASFVGDLFAMNLVFSYPKDRTAGDAFENPQIELLPPNDVASVRSFDVKDNTPGPRTHRKSLGITLAARKGGEHTFTGVRIRTRRWERTFDLGRLHVIVRNGSVAGDVLALSKTAGIVNRPVPLEISIENTSDRPMTLEEVVLPSHPDIALDAGSILLSGQPLPPGGYVLGPLQHAQMQVRWTVRPPDRPTNIEVRPMLRFDVDGREEYAGLQNVVFRFDPEWVPTPPAAGTGG